VDASGGPVFDPTKNVLDLVDAAIGRVDDMAELRAELQDVKSLHLRELGQLRAVHQRELDQAEASRLNSIRQVDREEVTKTAAANQAAITTLATSTATLAETLRTQVATTASAAEARQSASTAEMTKRLSALELSASASMGKQTVADPQLERLNVLVEQLARSQATGTGKSEGLGMAWVVMLGVVSLIVGLIAIGTFVFVTTRQAPAAIYTPAPAGTQLPTNPPTAVPR
jgi:hypothetical protein